MTFFASFLPLTSSSAVVAGCSAARAWVGVARATVPRSTVARGVSRDSRRLVIRRASSVDIQDSPVLQRDTTADGGKNNRHEGGEGRPSGPGTIAWFFRLGRAPSGHPPMLVILFAASAWAVPRIAVQGSPTVGTQ